MSTLGCSLSPSARNSAIPLETVASPCTSLLQAFCPMPKVKHLHTHIHQCKAIHTFKTRLVKKNKKIRFSKTGSTQTLHKQVTCIAYKQPNLPDKESVFLEVETCLLLCKCALGSKSQTEFILFPRHELANLTAATMSLCIYNKSQEGKIKMEMSPFTPLNLTLF